MRFDSRKMLTYSNLVLPVIPPQEGRRRHLRVMMLKVTQEMLKKKKKETREKEKEKKA